MVQWLRGGRTDASEARAIADDVLDRRCICLLECWQALLCHDTSRYATCQYAPCPTFSI
jgi:hypothetical protein